VLRHSRTATTTDVYMQEIPESVQKTVDAISAELRLLPGLEVVTRGTSDLLPNCYQTEKWGIGKYLKRWWTWSGSNRRPLPCHGSALPAAPQAQVGQPDAGGNWLINSRLAFPQSQTQLRYGMQTS
jgi:hypothetical protein